jgi:PAS domain S-box-containing protein
MRVGFGAAFLRPNHVFWIAIALLAAVSAATVLSTSRLVEQYSGSVRSQQTVLELNGFLSDLKDVETGARGYALTREPQFLQPYRLGKASLEQRLKRLRGLAGSGTELARGLGGLEAAADQRLNAADQLIRLAGNGDGQRQLIAAVAAGNSVMDRVREQAASLVAIEERAQAARAPMLQRQAVMVSIALFAGVASSLLVLVWLFSRLKHEIHRRREAEIELRQLNTELENRVQERTAQVRQARDLLDAVIENMPDMILLKERDGDAFRYLLINGAGERLIGREREEILGKTEREVFPADEAAEIFESNQAITASGQARTFTERTLTTPNGVRIVETRMVPIAREHDSPALLLAIVRDVTEQKSLQSQVREMQRLDSIGRLTGGIAHDFNNLLAVIMGNIELVRDRLPNGSETGEIADEALDAVRRGAELVRRLLAFARKQHLEPTAVNLNDRLPGIVPMLERTLGEKIRVQVKPAEQLWPARIDATQVDDALVNLAINARDAMRDGGTLTVETDNVILDEDYAAQHIEVVPGKYVMLAVSDTGTGMPPEIVARAFEPFFTTKSEGEGTGLGLSQVFGWVKQSGGHIKIYSELGHGTTVKLYLPRASEDGRRDDRAAREEVDGHGSETILLVEDNPHVRRTAVRQLSDLGYSVIEAEQAESALEKIRSGESFDLLLTDVVMPGGMSGYELAAAADGLRPGIKVLFTSGYTELAANGLRRSRKGPLISKPYSKSDLGRAIRSALDRPPGRKS